MEVTTRHRVSPGIRGRRLKTTSRREVASGITGPSTPCAATLLSAPAAGDTPAKTTSSGPSLTEAKAPRLTVLRTIGTGSESFSRGL